MHSSTSSSNDRLPRGAWLGTWRLAVLLVALIIGPWELWLRSRHFMPSVEASGEAWLLARRRVGPQTTVVTGNSRIQAVLDPTIWVAEMGGAPPVDLAVAGGVPIQVLEDLAADSTYHGLVLAEILPFYAFDVAHEDRVAREYLGAYQRARSSPITVWEAWMRVHVPSHFAFRRAAVLPGELYPQLVKGGRFPKAPPNVERPDRYHPIFFARVGMEPNTPRILADTTFVHLAKGVRPAKGPVLDSLFARINRSIQTIEGRGGHVVLLMFEACGGRKPLEERIFPKSRYWDPLRVSTATLTMDLSDSSSVSSLPCYDGSHIDGDDAPPVERLIARLVREALGHQPPITGDY